MHPLIIMLLWFFLPFILTIVFFKIRENIPNKSTGRYRIVLYKSLYNPEVMWYYIEHKPKRYIDKWNTVYGILKSSNTRYVGQSLHFNTEKEAKDYITNVLISEETNPLVEKKETTIISYHP